MATNAKIPTMGFTAGFPSAVTLFGFSANPGSIRAIGNVLSVPSYTNTISVPDYTNTVSVS